MPDYFHNVIAPRFFAAHQHLGPINTFLAKQGLPAPARETVLFLGFIAVLASLVLVVRMFAGMFGKSSA